MMIIRTNASVDILQLALANPGPIVMDKLHASQFVDLIGQDKVFLTVTDAVLTCTPKLEQA